MLFKPMKALREEYAQRRQLRATRLETEKALGGVAPYFWSTADAATASVTAPSTSGDTNTVIGVKVGSTTLNVRDVVGNTGSAPVTVTA